MIPEQLRLPISKQNLKRQVLSDAIALLYRTDRPSPLRVSVIHQGDTIPKAMMPTNPRDESKRHGNETLGRTPRQRRTLVIVVGLVVIAALGAFLAVVLLSDRRQEASEPAGVQSFENLSRNHTYEPVT